MLEAGVSTIDVDAQESFSLLTEGLEKHWIKRRTPGRLPYFSELVG